MENRKQDGRTGNRTWVLPNASSLSYHCATSLARTDHCTHGCGCTHCRIARYCKQCVFCTAAAYPQEARSQRKYALDGKIVGGSVTTIQKYPFALSLWRTDIEDYPEWNMCGASIASEYWVITAGHCNHMISASVMFVRAGNTYKDNGTRYDVAKSITHPKFYEHDDGSADFDIGLLKLKSPMVLSSSVKAVTLPSANTVINFGAVVTVVGWGSTHEMGSTVEVLREVSVPVVSIEECIADYGKDINNDTMVCAGLRKGGEDSCQGDSGGPLVLGSTQVGIVSWGGGCAEAKNPGVYTNVAYFRNWIKTETGL
ncbi:hypothetical protein PR048_006530 [Dryococelus australis]|uniref:Peptidase S1 domain-containing protein n=1 Tax=Dryococelus australis TaxID=614101 RepID=A0ABQ9IB75_9NEOP|nr:hypothetical protein PR048_006530 [Dryococelus australis]